MKKIHSLIFITILAIVPLAAQEEEQDTLPPGWSSEGKIQLLFNQSAFNKEWTGGGTSNIAGNFTLDYDLHYRKGRYSWDNRLLANYGLTRMKGDEFTRKTSDRIEFNSIAGREVSNSNWFYSFFLNLRTQLSKGYVYGEDRTTGDRFRTETSHFFSPAYLQIGPGMMWKKNEDLFVNIAPATSRFIFVDDEFTSQPGYSDGAYYGVAFGESLRYEFGASLTGYFKIEILENVSMENTISLYSNYLEKPGNIDIDYLLNLDMSINRFLSANLIFQAIYDDNTVGAFQIREVFGLGFNYSF